MAWDSFTRAADYRCAAKIAIYPVFMSVAIEFASDGKAFERVYHFNLGKAGGFRFFGVMLFSRKAKDRLYFNSSESCENQVTNFRELFRDLDYD